MKSNYAEGHQFGSQSEFNEAAPQVLAHLLQKLVSAESSEIGVFSSKGKTGSVISLDIINTKENIHLFQYSTTQYRLEFFFHDLENNGRMFEYYLNPDDIKVIPHGLINLMNKVRESKEPMTMNKNSF